MTCLLPTSQPAFLTPIFPSTRRSQPRWTCSQNPTEPKVPSENVSAVDRQYLAKIRDKLLNARRAIKAVKGEPNVDENESDALLTANLPDDLDEVEDILFDRGPNNVNQVRLFGGWLDDSVAGRKARDANVRTDSEKAGLVQPEEEEREEDEEKLTPEEMTEQANDVFADAMSDFNKGRYRHAVRKYNHAVTTIGEGSRLGGQYQLWHAQALDAAGEKKVAAKILENLRTHADSDVRKVSSELLFIMTAPKLELEPGSFLDIPSLDENYNSERMSSVLTSSYGPLKTALVDKEPEKYSLEWYMKKERPPKRSDNTAFELVAVLTAVCVTLAYLYATSPS